MKLTYSTWGMPMVPIAEALACAARLGYDGVEIAVTKSRDFSTELSKLDAAERRRIRALLDQYALELPAIAGHANLLAQDADEHAANLARLKATVDLCLDLAGPDGVPAMNTTAGGRKDQRAWPSTRQALVDRLGDLVAYADGRGVTVAIEPHVSTLLDTPDKAVWLLDQIDSPRLKLCFDHSHFDVQEGIPIEESVRLLAPHSIFTHVKEQQGIYPDHRFMIPGEGTYDYEKYLTLMAAAGYTGHIAIEVSFFVQDRPDYDPFAAAELSYHRLAQAFLASGIRREGA